MIVIFCIACAMIGILAGRIDKEIEQRGKIRHGLHVLGRFALIAGAFVGLSQIEAIPLLGIPMGLAFFGMTFRPAFNFFSLRKMGFVGTTALYDRAANWISRNIHLLAPNEVQITIEYLAIFIPLIIMIAP